jgi:xylulokinase
VNGERTVAHLLGIDLGTSRVKVLLVDERGEILGKGAQDYPLLTPQPGWVEQDPEQWWAAAVAAVHQALDKLEDKSSIAAIGLSGQMHGTVLMDERNRLLGPAVIWPDQRSSRQVEEISQLIGRERLIETTGSSPATGFQAATIRWFQAEENETFSQVHKMLLPKDYLRWRMTGNMASEPSDGAGSLLLDGSTRDWSAEILEKLEIDPRILPGIQPSLSLGGELTREASRSMGLPKNIPVIKGAADTASSLLGAGITSAKELLLTISSGGQLVMPAYDFNVDRSGGMHTFCSALEPDAQHAGWYLMSATLSAGLSLSWLRDNVFKMDWEFEQMTSWAEQARVGVDGLIFWPYLLGERSPLMNPQARGMFVGLTTRHGKEDLVGAVMEGVVFSLYDAFQVMIAAGVLPERIILAGGGAQSRFWRQMVADVFGLPVEKLRIGEQSALGAALMAGAGIGMFDIVTTSQKWAKYEDTIDPDMTNRDKYHQGLSLFRLIYQKMKANTASQSSA